MHQTKGSSGQEPIMVQSSTSQVQISQSSPEQGGVGPSGQLGSIIHPGAQTWKFQVTVLIPCSSETNRWHSLQGHLAWK